MNFSKSIEFQRTFRSIIFLLIWFYVDRMVPMFKWNANRFWNLKINKIAALSTNHKKVTIFLEFFSLFSKVQYRGQSMFFVSENVFDIRKLKNPKVEHYFFIIWITSKGLVVEENEFWTFYKLYEWKP